MDYDLNEIKILNIPKNVGLENLYGETHGIGGILVFPTKPKKVESLTEPIKIHLMKKKSWIYGRLQRRLVNESVGTFLSIQKICQVNKPESENMLVMKSKEYRSIVQVCISEMSLLLKSLEGGQTDSAYTASELQTNCEMLYKMELLLGLIEIVFLNRQPGGAVLLPLLNWIRVHFPLCRQRLAECISSDHPVLYPNYWETCYGLVLQGLLDEARELLSRHPDSNMDHFLSMDELLRKMPVYRGLAEAEFLLRWQHWQTECKIRLQRGEYATCSHLVTICKLLCGDQETLVNMVDVLDTWYHFMVSQLLFTNPTVKIHRLPHAAQEAMAEFRIDIHINSLDHLLLSILEMNDKIVLKQIQSAIDNLWFTVHLFDLLYHSLDKRERSYLQDIRESLLIDYSFELTCHQSLWQLGLLYLDHIDTYQSQTRTASVLEHMPLTNDSKALKIIHAAKNKNIDVTAMGICHVMGRKALLQDNFGSAIYWGIRSQDVAFTSYLAHRVLKVYMDNGKFVSTLVLDNLGSSILLSDTLTFLSKYREFHILCQEGEAKKAASLLVSLISSQLAPEYFWPILLEDILPLLQSTKPVLTSDQVVKLLYCLHNLSDKEMNKIQQNEKAICDSSFLDKEFAIRLALTNTLAQAIIEEGSSDH